MANTYFTVDETPNYCGDAGACVREIVKEKELKAAGDFDTSAREERDGPALIEVDDVLVVDNFLALTRRKLDQLLDEAQGNPEFLAEVRRQSEALDTFTRVVMPDVRLEACRIIETERMFGGLDKLMAMLGAPVNV